MVSIITPLYNSEKFLPQCVASVLEQTYDDWELILSDDCSSDNSVEIAREYCKRDQRIKLIESETNNGAGVARNKAIEYASGRYLAFLDSDDFWHQDKLKKQLDLMTGKGLPLVYCQYYVVEGDAQIPEYKICSPKKVDYSTMLRNDYIGFLTLIYDTEKLGKLYMPKMRRRQDWAYKLRLLKGMGYAHGIQEPLAFYRIGDSSLSSNKFKLLKYNFEVFRKELDKSWLESFLLMIRFLLYHFLYKLTSKQKVDFKNSS